MKDDTWSKTGERLALLQRLQSSGSAVLRWLGSDRGRYVMIYLGVVFTGLIGLGAGYRLGVSEQASRYDQLAAGIELTHRTQLDSQCIGLWLAAMLKPDLYAVPERCAAMVEQMKRDAARPPEG